MLESIPNRIIIRMLTAGITMLMMRRRNTKKSASTGAI
jgi:hypothetical protein